MLWVFCVEHMMKDNLNSKIEKKLPPLHGLLCDQQQGIFYTHHPTDKIVHATTFVTLLSTALNE